MCMICRRTPCDPRCPNAPEPLAVFTCRRCGEGIFPGDEYAQINGVEYCESCVYDMLPCTLIEKLGGAWKTGKRGETILCSVCGGVLKAGQEYGTAHGTTLCEDCAEDMLTQEVVELFGGAWDIAHDGDGHDG